MNVYGMCFYAGRGVEKDASQAIYWFRRAAAAGFPPAMDNLSSCHEKGFGVKADAKRALVWKMRSRAARGEKAASDWLRENNYSMSEAE